MFSMSGNFTLTQGKLRLLKESRKSEICSKYDLIPLVLASSFPLQMQAQVGFRIKSYIFFSRLFLWFSNFFNSLVNFTDMKLV